MGSGQSKEPPAPAPTGPPPLLSRPWRDHIVWSESERKKLLGEIYGFRVKGGVKYLNCLLLGQAASGKTSFFNTCATAVKDEGRVINPLFVLKSSGSSVTTKFETGRLNKQNGDFIKIRLFDCRGLHDINGVTPEDIRLIVDGHIKHGYTINPVSPIKPGNEFYRSNPGLSDMMHCVVYVVNAENPGRALVGDSANMIFSEIRVRLGERHVPQLVLMNKVDRLRASLDDNISDLFRSQEVKKKFDLVSDFMNLPDMYVLPMSNYHKEVVPSLKKDLLALTNLKTIMNYANDFVEAKGTESADFFD